MPIRVQCSCGQSQFAPDVTAGRTVLCLACRKQVPVPGSIPRQSKLKVILLSCALLLIPSVFIVVFLASRVRVTFVPVLEEYRNGSKEPVDPVLDRPKIEATLAKLVKASTNDNPEHFSWCFNFRRMLAEIELRGGLGAIGLKWEETSLQNQLDGGIRSFCENQRLTGTTWHSVKRCTVRFIEGRGEAEAFTLIRMKESNLRIRFWLIKEKNDWGIYDFEAVDVGIRESVTCARTMMKAAKGHASIQKIEKAAQLLNKGQQLLARGKAEDALAAFNEALPLSSGSDLLATIELFQAMVLFQLKHFPDALEKIDQTLRDRKDMPIAHHVRGFILYSLERYKDSIQAQEEYLRIIGDDAPAYHWIGTAYEELGKPDKAMEAYRKGAAADETDTDNRESLKALQDAKK